jgi:hypothetical protein
MKTIRALASSGRSDAWHRSGEIVIRRPIEEVFDFVADERNEPRYNHQMTAAELLTPEPIGPGSRFQAELRMRGRPIDLTVEFTRFERPRVLGSISHARPRGRRGRSMRTEGALIFEPVPAGTRMRWSWQVETPGPMKLISPLVIVIGRRQERRIWGQLKRLLEQETK